MLISTIAGHFLEAQHIIPSSWLAALEMNYLSIDLWLASAKLFNSTWVFNWFSNCSAYAIV